MDSLQRLFDAHLFRFEQDKYYALRRIPLAIRLKLDRCGVKLLLGDWVKFSRADREELLALPGARPEEVAAFAVRLKQFITAVGGDPDLSVPLDPNPSWAEASTLPASVKDYLTKADLPVPTLAQWKAWSELQRFAVCKLTRAGHDNKNLLPALREFGVLAEETAPAAPPPAPSSHAQAER